MPICVTEATRFAMAVLIATSCFTSIAAAQAKAGGEAAPKSKSKLFDAHELDDAPIDTPVDTPTDAPADAPVMTEEPPDEPAQPSAPVDDDDAQIILPPVPERPRDGRGLRAEFFQD